MNLCKNPRKSTIIVAILHLVLLPIGIIYFIYMLCTFRDRKEMETELEYDKYKVTILPKLWIGAIYCVLMLIATKMLIVGIKQKRHRLIEPFKHIIHFGGLIWLFSAIWNIYFGVKAKKSFWEIALPAIAYLIAAAFQWICYVPVSRLLKIMKHEASHDIPEHHALNTNHGLNNKY